MIEFYERENGRMGVRLLFPQDEGRTKQSFKQECDVNYILRNYARTGSLEHVRKYGGRYDFAPAVSFHEAMNIVSEASAMFEALPAKVRHRFSHDPGEFLKFVQEPENADEMRELGLMRPESRAGAVVSSDAEQPPIAAQQTRPATPAAAVPGDSPPG